MIVIIVYLKLTVYDSSLAVVLPYRQQHPMDGGGENGFFQIVFYSTFFVNSFFS